ncbi:MAG: (Fe-S)-binding protein [Bacteroidia bacterium]|nr:(Fe-S)-binding protein [Bacteroidia bacterium]
MKKVFAPGCALMLYKPHFAEKLHIILNENLGTMNQLLTCCKHEPQLDSLTEVINICPGCDKRYNNDYQNTTTISLWEILAGSDFFPFPDYGGRAMSILDACPTREKVVVHEAIRTLLGKMNIMVIEPEKTGTRSTCCGDSFYGVIPVDEVKKQMRKRSSEMPLDDVVVYCISCIKSVHIGGKKPHYLVDLLFGEDTVTGTYEPDEWHKQLDEYIAKH